MAEQLAQYLLEIGVEELPVGFIQTALPELVEKVKGALDTQSIAYESVAAYATPRRLALLIQGLPETQADRTVVVKGPPVRIALQENGEPTPAGLGFAKKNKAAFSELSPETDSNGEPYLVLHQTIGGRPVRQILPEFLPPLILSLSGSHFMAWGEHSIRFSRAIRWLLSLWNDTHCPLSIGPVHSDVVSYGHRVLSKGRLTIRHADAYLRQMAEEGHVLVDQEARREKIWAMLQETAKQQQATVVKDDDLLNTVTMLVEQPNIVVGHFEERFLDIPEEVTVMVMATHQKYFPLRKPDGRLLPLFMTVSNGRPEAGEIIRNGNEKVVRARLEDARFFFEEDRKAPLKERLNALKGLTFQKGLGSMSEKVFRLQSLATHVAQSLGYNEVVQRDVQEAALLAKADLVTAMVFELTELQGVMGARYAALEDYPASVAQAIEEHYWPRFTGDQVAKQPVSIAVSLADKMDTLVAVFSQKNAKLPSGSRDPLGLRRLALGIVQTVLGNQLNLNLPQLMILASLSLRASLPQAAKDFQPEESVIDLLSQFLLQRFKGILLEQGNRYDMVDAVLDTDESPLANLLDVIRRLETLKRLLQDETAFQAVYAPANRIHRILGTSYNANAPLEAVNADWFTTDAEKTLYAKLQTMPTLCEWKKTQDYDGLIAYLQTLAPDIAHFFDKVMVNDPDAQVRKNRYNLLSSLNQAYRQIAGFSTLVV